MPMGAPWDPYKDHTSCDTMPIRVLPAVMQLYSCSCNAAVPAFLIPPGFRETPGCLKETCVFDALRYKSCASLIHVGGAQLQRCGRAQPAHDGVMPAWWLHPRGPTGG